MKLTIDLPPGVQRVLEERAQQSRLSLAEFAAALLAEAAADGRGSAGMDGQAEIAARLAALERLGSYDTRAGAGLPPLSDEDVSRESIYEGRGL